MINGKMATDSMPGERQYHLQVGPGEVGRFVLMPGDPARTDLIAGRLDAPRLVAHNREFRTWTGILEGEPVSVVSTGIGSPSAAIAVVELLRLGVQVFVRVGSCGALQKSVSDGDLIVVSGAVRDEGTTRQYVPVEYPAVAHPQVIIALDAAARAAGGRRHLGIVYCKDALTAAFPTKDVPLYDQLMQRTHAWVKAGVLASEMESAVIFVLASIAGARAGSILQCIGPGSEAHFGRLIDVAVDGVARLIAGGLE
jgi:uridine phosphorylase